MNIKTEECVTDDCKEKQYITKLCKRCYKKAMEKPMKYGFKLE